MAIDLSKLEALDMVTLSKLRDSINTVLIRKMRMAARSGQEFEIVLDDESKRPGQRLRINGTGSKHLQGYEIDTNGNHLRTRRWRVSVKAVTVVPNYTSRPAVVRKPLRTGQDVPASVTDDAF